VTADPGLAARNDLPLARLSPFLTQLRALCTSLESDIPLSRTRDEHVRVSSRAVEARQLERDLLSALETL
jgi:hypothetical protein